MGAALAYINTTNVDDEMYQLIEGCVEQNRACQEKLYKKMYPKMMSMVRRYINYDQYHIAEEILNNGFLKVFQNISSYKFEGSFEGWVRRVIFHCLSDYIRQNIKYMEKVKFIEKDEIIDNNLHAKLGYDEILKLVCQLPETSRAVFNMYAIEGFTHKEIATELNMNEGTSKWHMHEARKILKIKIENLEK